MERRFILLLAFLLSVSLPGNAGAQNKVALQGKWRAVEATSNGEPPPAGVLEKLTIVFVGKRAHHPDSRHHGLIYLPVN